MRCILHYTWCLLFYMHCFSYNMRCSRHYMRCFCCYMRCSRHYMRCFLHYMRCFRHCMRCFLHYMRYFRHCMRCFLHYMRCFRHYMQCVACHHYTRCLCRDMRCVLHYEVKNPEVWVRALKKIHNAFQSANFSTFLVMDSGLHQLSLGTLSDSKQTRMMKTQLPQALLRIAEILLGKKGAFYSNQAALLGEVVAPEGGKRGRTCVHKGRGLYSLCLSLLVLQKCEETGVTDFIPRKASSRLSLVPNNA